MYYQDYVCYQNYKAAINASKSSAEIYNKIMPKWKTINTPAFSM